jgi:hypothetical protein
LIKARRAGREDRVRARPEREPERADRGRGGSMDRVRARPWHRACVLSAYKSPCVLLVDLTCQEHHVDIANQQRFGRSCARGGVRAPAP